MRDREIKDRLSKNGRHKVGQKETENDRFKKKRRERNKQVNLNNIWGEENSEK
jgi:hypothetical protein